MPLLDPQELELNGRTYLIGKWPAVAGREIIAGYPLTALPKIGEYKANEEIMLKLMAHVAVMQPNGEPLTLGSRALVDNHVPDWETLAKIEFAALERNCSFFRDGRLSGFLANAGRMARSWITQTLTASLAPLSRPASPLGSTSVKGSRSRKQ